MIGHQQLGSDEMSRSKSLMRLYKSGQIQWAGNLRLKIYGKLRACGSGKRMKAGNRVFFQNEEEAINAGFRPCGHCMKRQYNVWKQGNRSANSQFHSD